MNEAVKNKIAPAKNEIVAKHDAVSVNPQDLISKAIENNVPIEQLEKLLAMRRELKAENAREAYFESLSKFQKECPVIKKTSIVNEKNSDKVRYKYASLDTIVEQVKKPLKKHGFSYTIKTKQTDKSVTAICQAHHEFGHTEESEFEIPLDSSAYMNVSQRVASALTYAKRYAFCNAFGIMTGDPDDDAQATEEQPAEKLDNKPDPLIDEIKKILNSGFFNSAEQNKTLDFINGKSKDVLLRIKKKCEKTRDIRKKAKTPEKHPEAEDAEIVQGDLIIDYEPDEELKAIEAELNEAWDKSGEDNGK